MKKRLLFERLCRDLVAVVLASSGAGCGAIATDPSPGGSTPTPSATSSSLPPNPPTTVGPVETLVCTGGLNYGLAGLTPQPAIDYVALRYDNFQSEFDAGATLVSTSEEFGSKCATASNRAKCLADLESFRGVRTQEDCIRGPMQMGCGNSYLVYTRGDTIGAALTREEVVRFFGTVDSPEEAFYLAHLDGYYWHCTGPNKATARRVNGSLEIVVIAGACGPEDKIVLRVAPDGKTEFVSTERLESTAGCSAAGRRPEGMTLEARVTEREPVGAHLARIAELEAAAVSAFAIMADELEALDAPPTLVKQAHAARRDEIRHARTMARLARARGARPRRVGVNRRRDRAVVDIAIENAVEGCVRETYAALVALFQAERAHDADVREAMVTIATDELRHAELSWRVGEWLDTRLDEGARAEVEAARARAVRDLERDIESPVDADAMVALGLPSKAVSRALYRGLCDAFGLDPVTPS